MRPIPLKTISEQCDSITRSSWNSFSLRERGSTSGTVIGQCCSVESPAEGRQPMLRGSPRSLACKTGKLARTACRVERLELLVKCQTMRLHVIYTSHSSLQRAYAQFDLVSFSRWMFSYLSEARSCMTCSGTGKDKSKNSSCQATNNASEPSDLG